MAGGRLKIAPMISHRFPIEEAPQAYQIITGKRKSRFWVLFLCTRRKRLLRYRVSLFRYPIQSALPASLNLVFLVPVFLPTPPFYLP